MPDRGPLDGVKVVELPGGVGGAWCGRLLADLGAEVFRLEPAGDDPLQQRREDPDKPETGGLLDAWLNADKTKLADGDLESAVAGADLLIVGEDADRPALAAQPRRATVDISWFGLEGPYAGWRGADVAIHALCGVLYPCGPAAGPPRPLGDIQAALVGGCSGAIAAITGLIAEGAHRTFEVSILEACMVLSELQSADAQFFGRPTPRTGINRFSPTTPISIHRCKEGWLGLTVITIVQWRSFCEMIGEPDLADEPDLANNQLREPHAQWLEAIFNKRLKARTASEWAAIAREKRVPLVEVPDAGQILDHPIFAARRSIRSVGIHTKAPASPLKVAAPQGQNAGGLGPASADPLAPLAGLRIGDFSMGWAGPLATRILADLGADVIKIEAGRYPDWWRATQWTKEAIAQQQFEKSCRFAAMNRNKRSVSFDMTTPEGLDLTHRLIQTCDAVVENHAAGVIERLGAGWDVLSKGRSDLVMMSMSCFGFGNAWSEQRAYGTTLEQAAGMPSFRGRPDEPPVMGHIAYGDPVGGIYGAAALLAALFHRKRTGLGQQLNMSHVDGLLPFTAPALLHRSATGAEPRRLGAGHPVMAPHGVYPARGDDAWITIAADSDVAWSALAEAIGRSDLRNLSLAERRARSEELDAAIGRFTQHQDAVQLATDLQARGVIAAHVLTPESAMTDPHLVSRGFFFDTERAHVGHQRQSSLAMVIDGGRPPLRTTAPFLGAATRDVLVDLLGEDEGAFDTLVRSGVVSLTPTSLRGAVVT